MFTGIVQAIGRVETLAPRGADRRLRIDAGKLDLSAVRVGDSIAVSGVCLTVTARDDRAFEADVSAETLRCTTFAGLDTGDAVNLETALTLATPLGGHLVSGHVDGVGMVKARDEVGQSLRYVIAAPAELARYIAVKGSICVDGVSLTVNAVDGAAFEVNLVPHTLQETTLRALRPGSPVNLEVDLMARYAERLLQGSGVGHRGLTREALQRAGLVHE
jgi:riboflavin synthase